MGLFRKAIFVGAIGVIISYFVVKRDPGLPPVFGGHVEPGFESVEQAFRQNFADGFEPDGAAFAVCHRGKLVVDLWGGYADTMSMRPWKRDTITTAFSTTKGVAALVVAVLVDRGYIKYEDLVIKYWPEFGAHGKSNVTVKMLVGHEAGLAALDGRITMEVIKDWRLMSKLFEDQVPNWPPGTDAGYHAFTHGWLCDQLVHRVDPQHRSLGQFFREEIAERFGIDFHIGLPRDQLYRVARMTLPTAWDFVKRLGDWDYVRFVYGFYFRGNTQLMQKIMKNPDWLNNENNRFKFNDPDMHELEIPAAGGIGTARALAQLYCLLDGSDLLNQSLVKKISQPCRVTPEDAVVGMNVTWGWGFTHGKKSEGHYTFGHPGYGGQNAKYDPQEHLAIGYLRNNMAPDMDEYTRTFKTVQRATYESVKALKR